MVFLKSGGKDKLISERNKFYHKIVNKNFFKSEFTKNVSTLTLGTLIAQLFSIVTMPVLTRLYSPFEFGVFGIFTSIISIGSVVAAGRYELAIMLPERDDDAKSIVSLSTIICTLLCIILLILIIPFREEFALLFDVNSEVIWLWFVPFGIFVMTYFNIMNYYTNRKGKYRALAGSRVFRSVLNSGTGIGLGFLKWDYTGLILGVILGNGISSSYLFYKTKENKVKIGRGKILKAAKEYSDFPKKSIPGAFFNILAGQLPVLLIAGFYGASVVGLYALTMRILSIPMNLVGKSVAQVFYQKAAEIKEQGALSVLVRRTTVSLFLIIIIPMAVLGIWGPELFGFFFGEEWETAGKISQIMVPFFLVRFIFSSQSTIMMVLRRMDFEVKFNFLFLASQLAALYAGYYFYNDFLLSFLFMSAAGFVVFSFLGFWIYRRAFEPR